VIFAERYVRGAFSPGCQPPVIGLMCDGRDKPCRRLLSTVGQTGKLVVCPWSGAMDKRVAR
jgi:hypothetical protein